MRLNKIKRTLSVTWMTILLVAMTMATGCGKKVEDTSAQAESTTATEGTAASTEEVTTQEVAKSEGTLLYDVQFALQSNWGDTGAYGGTYNVSFTNNSTSAVSSWYIEADIPEGCEPADAWGCTVKAEGKKLTITATDWGAAVAAGQKIDVGFNMNSKELFTTTVKTLYVNGSQVDLNALSLPEVADNSTEASTGTTTETEPAKKPETESGTPLENHGKLSVKGTQLVDKNGKPYQLKGVSTHGLAWFPEYVNKDAFQTIRDDWGGNVIRLALYTHEYGGYCSGGDQNQLKALLDNGVNYATELGMYVIIDWHVLQEQNPRTYQGEAEAFFKEISARYADYDNVLYEICNEPNGGVTWASDVRPYAESIIPIIRANDKDAVIIVGTPTWSQDVDVVADDWVNNPIKDAGNVMFAIHFYAATHTDSIRNKVTYALDKGLPVFVSEFSLCDASGNGGIDYNQSEQWFKLINDNNLSYCSWSLSNKAETSALISSGCSKTSGWSESDLSETGKWIRNQIKGTN